MADRAPASGNQVTDEDLPVILAMLARGDRKHDIAAWFGLNQGRIKGAEEGKYGTPPLAHQSALPPSGSPGPKALGARVAMEQVHQILTKEGPDGINEALERLREAMARFDQNE
ncbi:MAG TPA: hypothetical protein VNO69_11345 [Methyloceanibacter sp.]|nr:hypothetical protein [Methyloceanibacter sp.]